MSTFTEFNLGVNPKNAWLLGEPGAVGDCRTIVRYVIKILLMVGVPGEAKCVLVCEKLRDRFPGWAMLDKGDPSTEEDDKMVPVTGKDVKVY